MPASVSDIKLYASTPATGSSKCLGGAIQTGTELQKNMDISNPIYDQFMRDFTNTERNNGARQYHCFFIKNTHVSLTLTGGKLWFSNVTPNPDTYTRMGLETNAKTTAAHTIANDVTAPSGIDLDTRHNALEEALSLPDLAPNDYVGIWIAIELRPSATTYNKDYFIMRLDIYTPA